MSVDIVSYRLQNQHLSSNKLDRAAEVVRRLGAVQSQDFSGGKWAIGLRTDGVMDPHVQRAFDEGAILRTHVMRPTWHFVAPQDIRWLLALTSPRVHAANDSMYRALGLTASVFAGANKVMARALGGGRYLTRDELRNELQSLFEQQVFNRGKLSFERHFPVA